MSEVEELFARARAELAAVPTEPIGEWAAPRRILGLTRAPRIVPVGDAWHVGVLLLTDDAVFATGDIVRAREEERRGFTAESQRERAATAAAAFRGGFPEGAAVHIGWTRLDASALDRGEASGPLAVRDGVASVRWSTAGAYQPLADYLRDRVALLRSPPPRA
nr:glutaminase [Microbacterium sp. 18062]